MDKTYNPQAIEQHWYQQWESNDYFSPRGDGPSYCLMIPPPNVTGTLHMGHGFQNSLMDALVRYHRMRGDNTLWQVGTDHAGIATQMVVERQLLQQNSSRQHLGRDEFIKKVWEWKAQSGGQITQQLRRLGSSVDWSRECFTMDEQLSKAVREVFIKLFDEGLIYRGKRLVNWDPKFLTAISDLEVNNEDEAGHLWHIRYPLADGSGTLTVATTRPETLLGDVAVAVHPDDERYQKFIGKKIKLPLTDREIPVIADDYVERDFGSGCVKITPAHDFNDYAVGVRHQLPLINIYTPTMMLNENTPEKYRGLERFEARKKIVDDLASANLLEKIEDYTRSTPRGDRSGEIIEPYLTDQWYVKMAPLAAPAIDVVRDGKIKFIPENWSKTYFQWLENIEDWCISRQLWWGHRVPAWYDEDNNIYVGHSENEVREKYQLSSDRILRQDTDVLDTWFSSALWPFSTLGWPENTAELKKYYPTQVLVTGFDIIFFWVARMIMMGLKFTGEIPFHEIYITGLIRDAEGQKMSKSKGNILDPIDLIDGIDLESLVAKRTSNMMQPQLAQKIEKQTRQEFPNGIDAYGTDALRFTFCSLASTGRDIRFDIARLEGNRNFCNKLWNAARYVLMNCENHDLSAQPQPYALSSADRFIIAKTQLLILEIEQHFQNYRFDLLAKSLYEFIWYEYCDWYLELSKPVLYSQESSDFEKHATRHTLINVFETVLRCLHPLMPFITEEIWQRVAPVAAISGETIMQQPYPAANKELVDHNVISEIEWVKHVVLGIRNIRGEMNISPGKAVPVFFHKGDVSDQQRVEKNRAFLSKLAKLDHITWLDADENPPPSAMALAGSMEILVPLAGLIDVVAEKSRLQKERDKHVTEKEKLENKLANERFVSNAPADVVEKERTKLAEINLAIRQIESQFEKLAQL